MLDIKYKIARTTKRPPRWGEKNRDDGSFARRCFLPCNLHVETLKELILLATHTFLFVDVKCSKHTCCIHTIQHIRVVVCGCGVASHPSSYCNNCNIHHFILFDCCFDCVQLTQATMLCANASEKRVIVIGTWFRRIVMWCRYAVYSSQNKYKSVAFVFCVCGLIRGATPSDQTPSLCQVCVTQTHWEGPNFGLWGVPWMCLCFLERSH